MLGSFYFITKNIEKILIAVGEFAILLYDTFRLTFQKDFSFKLLADQIIRIGVESLVVSSVTGLFTGMVMALQISLILETMLSGVSQYMGGVVSIAMVKELAPVLTGLIIAGRVGSAVTAELGSMTISEQVDALKTLNANPIAYLVVPRFWAGIITLPMLTAIADLVGILGGAFVGITVFSLNPFTYFERAISFIEVGHFLGGLVKALVFGGIITLVACYAGMTTKGGAKGLGIATTKSVVYSFMLILVSDYFLVLLLQIFGM